jgi:hypothetical protein
MSSVYIPASVRGPIYMVFGVLGLGLGAAQVGFAAANSEQPVWLTVALAVYAFLGIGIGYTAASNTPAAPSNNLQVVPNNEGGAVGVLTVIGLLVIAVGVLGLLTVINLSLAISIILVVIGVLLVVFDRGVGWRR